jgi:hypothetical protein
LISRTASSLNSRVNCRLSMTHLLLHKTPNSVSSEPGAAQIKPVADELESVRIGGIDLVEKYQRSWESGRQIIEKLYQGSDDKVAALKAVAGVFKERTIDRTRRLFGNRSVELQQYIDQLSGFAQEMQRAQ